ncbi:Acyl-CoA-binding domain-containing protein 2 [Striga hermonthica]|uniref:Acyl-CoA-binding domain-containing protein 2 n=1 Tax=Striga hermonthica TaxID=68872 RepID=A0A9N7QZL0_STRHE|nr:Acyl-CoA-binding domain-containing protein 2 [Striga hermonthica]
MTCSSFCNRIITQALSPELKSDRGCRLGEAEPLIGGDGKSGGEREVFDDFSDSDDDWEGVESSELDELFSAATAFIAATAADQAPMKVSNDVQLQLYGLYKIATEVPCSTPSSENDCPCQMKKKDEGRSDTQNAGSQGPMRLVFSSFIYEEESGS